MTVKDVVCLAAQYLGENDLLETTTLGGTKTPTEQQTEKLNLLLVCANDMMQTLAVLYFPLKYEEKLTNSTGKILFSNLSKPVTEILKVVEEHGYSADFAVFPTYFETVKGQLTVVYNYLPAEVEDYSDTLEVAEGYVTKRLFALGVVSRYFLFNGMYTDAEQWQNMFASAVLVAQRPKTIRTMRKRRWL